MSFVNSTALANLSISEWLGIISALALVVVALFSLYNFVYGRKDRQVKKIDDEVNIVYFPMLDVIDNFLKKKGWTRNTPAIINDTSELENAIEDLIRIVKLKGYKIDDKVMTQKTRFFGHNSNRVSNLSVFLEFIEGKIMELQDEKRKYM